MKVGEKCTKLFTATDRFKSIFLVNKSSNRPGVQIKIFPPFCFKSFTSSSTELPPTSNAFVIPLNKMILIKYE